MPSWLSDLIDAPGDYVQSRANAGAQQAIDDNLRTFVIVGAAIVVAIWIVSR